MVNRGISILAVTAAALAAVATSRSQNHETETRRYQFPDYCTCNYKKLDDTCSRITEPDQFPTYNMMGFTGDCIPKLEANTRVCYTTKMADCKKTAEYQCRLFVGDKKLGYRVRDLPVTGGNASSVIIDSLETAESKTVCFYNISVAENSANNCSGVKIEHAANHSPDHYVDKLPTLNTEMIVDDSASGDSSSASGEEEQEYRCRSFVRVYYTQERANSSQQYYTLCRERLAEFSETLSNVTSLLVVYWTNNDVGNNVGSSFQLRAQCVE